MMRGKEEKRVSDCIGHDSPTVASTVTLDTPLSQLNLNWRESDLPERERTRHVHRLHPYLGKYIPQLVEISLRRYFSPGQTVFDPFAGSCTTLVQANELGIHAFGCDVSAFNVLLGRAKTAKYDLVRLRAEVLEALAKTRAATQAKDGLPGLWDTAAAEEAPEFAPEDNPYLREWFAPQALRELLAYRQALETGGYAYTDLMNVILSRSARSARLTTHFDLDFPKKPQTEDYWCCKHSRNCRPTTEAFKFLERYSRDSLKRIEQFAAVRTDAAAAIHHADSREIDLPPIQGIITSPPYVGLIDYYEQHACAYRLLGLEDRRGWEIGAAAGGAGVKARQQYQQDIAQVFRRAADALPSGAPIIVVAGDRAALHGEIAALSRVEVEAVVQRHVNRRTGRRSGEFYESVFIWRKP